MNLKVKNTNSLLIRSILLLTFLAFSLVSCHKSYRSVSIKEEKAKKSDSAAPEKEKVKKLISTARSFIGTPYKFGGCSRNGMDCSGLVYTCFQSINIELPRTSSAQSTSGKTVRLEEIKPGDLIFFTDKKGNNKITHVGIVSEVKNAQTVKFIHASTKLGVVEDNLYAEYYISVFLKAIRVL
jgi:cell wall-associated NlpC family hydrolase